MDYSARYIEFVKAANEAKTQFERDIASARYTGFCEGLEIMGINIGRLAMDADIYYLDQGIDRPMCGGIFIDWKAST